MANKASTNSSAPVADKNEQKMRKKQAKQEAKMMLEIEETKVSINKAEKTLAKAQARLEARNTHLHTLEAALSEFRTSHKETEVSAPDAGIDQQTGQPELKEATKVSAQHSDSAQQAEQSTSADEEATILPDATSSDHQQTAQPELEEIVNSNQ